MSVSCCLVGDVRQRSTFIGLVMVFALVDYCRYRRRAGRFARDLGKSVMGGAFEGSIPDAALEQLHAGDVILVQSLDKFTAWVIMYVTQSEVSHVAMYLGARHISHSTPTAGVVTEPVEVLFIPNSRLLPCIWKMPDKTRAAIPDHVAESWVGRPYATLLVLLKGLNILSGRDWPAFRWRFSFDILLALVVLDLPFWLVLHFAVTSWMIPLYALVVLFNAARWQIRPPKMGESFWKPSDMLRVIVASGGAYLVDGIDVQKQCMARRARSGKERQRAAAIKDMIGSSSAATQQPDGAILRLDFVDRDGSSVMVSTPRASALRQAKRNVDDVGISDSKSGDGP